MCYLLLSTGAWMPIDKNIKNNTLHFMNSKQKIKISKFNYINNNYKIYLLKVCHCDVEKFIRLPRFFIESLFRSNSLTQML